MKSIFNVLKNIKSNLNKKPLFTPLDPNPNTLNKLIPDTKIIKKQLPVDFEDYIDGVFRKNPHLSEQEMHKIYHDHKKTYESANLQRASSLKKTQYSLELEQIKDKLNKTTDEKTFHKLYNQFIKTANKFIDEK